MNTIIRIRTAFSNWFNTTNLDLQVICTELQNKYHRGFDYATITAYLPLKKETIDKYVRGKSDINDDLLKDKLIAIVEHCGFELIFKDQDDLASCLTESDQLDIRKVVNSAPEDDEYLLYYVKTNESFAKETILLNFKTYKASIIRSRSESEKNLIGSIQEVNKSVYVISFLNDDDRPYWFITYNKSKSGKKDFRISSYLKISGQNSQPAVGVAVIVKASAVNNEIASMDNFAEYLLFRKRNQVLFSKFVTAEILSNEGGSHKLAHVKTWHNLQKFIGTWEGFFVNPIGKRFESSVIKIEKNGHFKMWIPSDLSTCYEGICKKINDLLVIKYQHLDEIDDYRSSIVAEVNGYNGEVYSKDIPFSTIFGVLGCIERGKDKPVATKIALRKISDIPLNISESGIKPLDMKLERKANLAEFNSKLRKLKLYNFFYGIEKPEYCSLDWLKNIGNI